MTHGEGSPDRVGYRDAYTDWIDSDADPTTLAERFGFDKTNLFGPGTESGALEDASEEQIEQRAFLANSLGDEEDRNRLIKRIELQTEANSGDSDARESLANLIEEDADLEEAEQTKNEYEGRLEDASISSALGKKSGLYTPQEMALIQSFVSANRGFDQGATNASMSGLLTGIDYGQLDGLPHPSNLLGARSSHMGERFTVRFDANLFGVDQASVDQLFLDGGPNEGFTPGKGPNFVEPVPGMRMGGLHGGGFMSEQQGMARFASGQEMNFNQARNLLTKMDETELEEMQRELWRMGYYGETAILQGALPDWGVNNASTKKAYFDFVFDLFLDPSRDATVVRNRKRRETYGIFQDLKNKILGLDQGTDGVDIRGIRESFTIAADEDIDETIQKRAETAIGQRLSEEEMAKIRAIFREGEQEELDKTIAVAREEAAADAEFQRAQSKRTRFLAHTGALQVYDEFGELITPTKNPNRGFADTFEQGEFVEPVAGFDPSGQTNPTPDDLNGFAGGDFIGRDVINTVERAPTIGAVADAQLRAQQGHKVFARDMSRAVTALRDMIFMGGR
jgi:hypothetical protein